MMPAIAENSSGLCILPTTLYPSLIQKQVEEKMKASYQQNSLNTHTHKPTHARAPFWLF